MAPRKQIPGVDAKLLIKDAAKLLPEPSRRFFLRGAGSLGALAVLSGCDIIDGDTSEKALRVVSRFNDRVQAWLFNPNALQRYSLGTKKLLPTPSPARVFGVKSAGYANIEPLPR